MSIPNVDQYIIDKRNDPLYDKVKLDEIDESYKLFLDEAFALAKQIRENSAVVQPNTNQSKIKIGLVHTIETRGYNCGLRMWVFLQRLVNNGEFSDLISQQTVDELYPYETWEIIEEHDRNNLRKLPKRIGTEQTEKYTKVANILERFRTNLNEHCFRTNEFLMIMFFDLMVSERAEEIREFAKKKGISGGSLEEFKLAGRIGKFFDSYKYKFQNINKEDLKHVVITGDIRYNAWDACSDEEEILDYTSEYHDIRFSTLVNYFDKIKTIKEIVVKDGDVEEMKKLILDLDDKVEDMIMNEY